MSIDCNNITKNNNLLTIINDDSYNNNINKQKDYKKTNTFYLNTDNLSKNKSLEKYVLKKNYFPQTIEKTKIKEIGWSPEASKYKSRICCSSVAFNIISPSLKSFSQTKKDIDLYNKNNLSKAHFMSDYIDMSSHGKILREDLNNKLRKNNKALHKKNFVAFRDLNNVYKDLI